MNCAATRKPTYSVNLDSTLRKVYLNDIFATGDCCANGVTLPMFKGNAPAVFGSGATVKGYFTRYGEKESVLLTGELNGHVASVELNKACYTKSGQFALVVKLYEGDVTSTIFYGEGSVLVADAGAYIDPDGIVPSLDELLAQIADMEAATADGRAAAQEARDAAARADEAYGHFMGVKADAIMDESARAASHTLYAQDGRMSVTLYGATTETGTGEKSPENPYTISGIENATVTVGDDNTTNTYTLPLLPDESPLMGNGTVDDSVENDCASGCDRRIVLDGSETWYMYTSNGVNRFTMTLADAQLQGAAYSDRFAYNYNALTVLNSIWIGGASATLTITHSGETLDEWKSYLAANPLTVYYRSTEYTHDKDLKVCKVARRYAKITLTGGETITSQQTSGLYNDGNHNRYRAMITLPNGIKIKAQSVSNVKGNIVCNVYDTASGEDTWYQRDGISDAGTSSANCVYIYDSACADEGADAYKAKFKALYEAGTPVVFSVELATPETYVTDPLPLRKPDTLESDTVTVTGSGETSVTYPHDTKHYTDAQHDSLAGAVERNAEAVSALSEEKANKADIPAPYALPTASANTLGGVKVGNGLQMDGDVLGVKPGGKFKKIDEVIIKEPGIMVIDKNTEPDGTPYNFEEMWMEVIIPLDKSKVISSWFYNEFGSVINYMSFSISSGTAENIFALGLLNVDGLKLPIIRDKSSNGARGNISTDWRSVSNGYVEGELIVQSIRISTNEQDGFAENTKISIYGVRADA